MNKKAFIILGAESSGTRVMAEVFVRSGCVGGYGHIQEFDDISPTNQQYIVWRRSVPHAKIKEPDVVRIYDELINAKYDIAVIVTMRDMNCMIQSQLNAPHILCEADGVQNISDAYLFIFSFIKDLNLKYHIINYESLILHQEPTLKYLSSLIDFPLSPIEFRNENTKWIKNLNTGIK